MAQTSVLGTLRSKKSVLGTSVRRPLVPLLSTTSSFPPVAYHISNLALEHTLRRLTYTAEFSGLNNSCSGSICPDRNRDRVDLTSSSRIRVVRGDAVAYRIPSTAWDCLERSERSVEGLPN